MSMAASIESRVPFLDHKFVEFSVTVPDHLKIRGGTQKYILKRAVEGLIPREVIDRRKMGFPTPLRQWLREPQAEGVLRSLVGPDSWLGEYVDRRAVATYLERHRSGALDATDRIWRLLNLQMWGDLFLTGKRGSRGGQEPAFKAEQQRGPAV
jgi:asparagine synthase (glutamine-hydrolysing)